MLVQINKNPKPRTLRQFAGTLIVFVAIWAIVSAAHGTLNYWRAIAIGVGAVVGLLGVRWPVTVKALYIGATYATLPIGYVMSHVVLGFVFFGLITPAGVIGRIFGRDHLAMRRRQTSSYWIKKNAHQDPEYYLRQ